PFHWELEFPEVFYEDNGTKRERGGFDAILANPPWDLIMANSLEFFSTYDPGFRELERTKAIGRQKQILEDVQIDEAWHKHTKKVEAQVDYISNSEVYNYQTVAINGKRTRGHVNTFKLFLERSFTILRSNGKCGIIIPGALYTDQGCTGLREVLLLESQISHLYCFENRNRIFPIHRSFKFILLDFEKKQPVEVFEAAFMLQNLDVLAVPERVSINIPIHLI